MNLILNFIYSKNKFICFASAHEKFLKKKTKSFKENFYEGKIRVTTLDVAWSHVGVGLVVTLFLTILRNVLFLTMVGCLELVRDRVPQLEALVDATFDETRSLANRLDAMAKGFIALRDSQGKHVTESKTRFYRNYK